MTSILPRLLTLVRHFPSSPQLFYTRSYFQCFLVNSPPIIVEIKLCVFVPLIDNNFGLFPITSKGYERRSKEIMARPNFRHFNISRAILEEWMIAAWWNFPLCRSTLIAGAVEWVFFQNWTCTFPFHYSTTITCVAACVEQFGLSLLDTLLLAGAVYSRDRAEVVVEYSPDAVWDGLEHDHHGWWGGTGGGTRSMYFPKQLSPLDTVLVVVLLKSINNSVALGRRKA